MAKYDVDPTKKFERALKKTSSKISDLTIPFTLMTKSWFKSNRSIFDVNRKGPGKYKDLSPKYKILKNSRYGFTYPILRASGKLAGSMTNPQHPDSVNLIVNKKILILGTKVTTAKGAPYNIFLHRGTRKMAARPYVLLGAEQVAPSPINKRTENWTELLSDFIMQVSESFGSKK